MSRIIVGLQGAWPIKRPDFVKKGATRGAKAQGLRYEKSVFQATAKNYRRAAHGQWFSFEDMNGPGLCQPDILIEISKSSVFVLECKLTDTDEALFQIRHLYIPVVETALDVKVAGAVVCKNLRSCSKMDNIVPDIASAIGFCAANPREIPIIHWLGNTLL